MIEATLDRTLVQENPNKAAARAGVERHLAEAILDSPNVRTFIERLMHATGAPQSEIEDCFWDLIDSGQIMLTSDLNVRLR